MKQGLSLRVSQHLALTPQLQQSIRLLQLSTLELSSEIEQMLDDNPFLEKDHESAEREEYGLDKEDAPLEQDTLNSEAANDLEGLEAALRANEESGFEELQSPLAEQADVFENLNSVSSLSELTLFKFSYTSSVSAKGL